MLSQLREEGYSTTVYTFSPGTRFGDHSHSCEKKDSIIHGDFLFRMDDEEVKYYSTMNSTPEAVGVLNCNDDRVLPDDQHKLQNVPPDISQTAVCTFCTIPSSEGTWKQVAMLDVCLVTLFEQQD